MILMVERRIISALLDMDFGLVRFQSDDLHAWYFEAVDEADGSHPKVEVKVERDGYCVSYRLIGKEDWIAADSLDLD
jgi:hypothetical protein